MTDQIDTDMTGPEFVDANGLQLAYWRWGDARSKPPAVLVHGTAFVAATWRSVAEGLSEDFCVYAYDRRGHGYSGSPDDNCYQFREFARDLVGFMDALDLQHAYGVGHSGGGTDMLLAAGMRPDLFERMFIMEPTVRNPDKPADDATRFAEEIAQIMARTLARRSEFPDPGAVYDHFAGRGALGLWQPEILKEYIRHGFKLTDSNGQAGVCLRCSPAQESAILKPIMLTMRNCDPGDPAGDPFVLLKEIDCRTLITSSQRSPMPAYRVMADIAAEVIAGARRLEFPNVSHCVPQESPRLLLDALKVFAAEK